MDLLRASSNFLNIHGAWVLGGLIAAGLIKHKSNQKKQRAESFSAECVSCSTPEGYYRGWPLCPQSGKPLCLGCCDCNDCRTKWNQLEYGETEPGRQHRAESFSAEGKCSMYCKGKNDVKKGSLACEPCAKKWGERMKKDKDFQRNYNPPEDYYRAESFATETIKPMTIGLGLGIVALFLWGRNR